MLRWVIFALVAGALGSFVPAAGCTAAQLSTLGCPTATGTDVYIYGERVVHGTRTQPGSPGNPGPPTQHEDPDAAPWYPPKEFQFDACLTNWDSYVGCFRASQDDDDTPAAEEAAQPAMPAITLADIAQFSPEPVTTVAEPDNVGVAGMPVNFVAAASVHTRSGTLFGTPLSVRFTPVGYDFVHGDGTSATTTTGGRTWEELGQPPFTPTDTSHVYRERGTYQAHVSVRYRAEVDLGVGWFPVDGELAIDGPVQEIHIFEAHTALVARTCAEQPGAPGC